MSHRRLRIVLIEPNPSDVRWLEIVLNDVGISHHIVRFSSAVQALSTIEPDEELTADLVVMAYGLPFLVSRLG